MTQGEMNDCAVKELHKAELKLEGLLKQLGIGRDSPEQKAWEVLPGRTVSRALSTRRHLKLRVRLPPVLGYFEEDSDRRPNTGLESARHMGRR
jgi:hypothetical protein